MSRRQISASPTPLSTAASGSSSGSAAGAHQRTPRWARPKTEAEPATEEPDVAGPRPAGTQVDGHHGQGPEEHGEQQHPQLGAAGPVRRGSGRELSLIHISEPTRLL